MRKRWGWSSAAIWMRVFACLAFLLGAGRASAIDTGLGLIGWDSQAAPGTVVGVPNPIPSSFQSYQGDELTFVADVRYTFTGTPATPPSGTITFYDGAQVIAVLPMSLGPAAGCDFYCFGWQAKLLTKFLTVGTHTVTAVYDGDGLFATSTSNSVTVAVVPALPPVASPVTAMGLGGWDSQPPPSPPGVVVGMPMPLPRSIQSYQGDQLTFLSELYYSFPPNATQGAPTGSVTFYDGTQLLAVVPLTFGPVESCNWFCNGPQARLLTNVLTVGTHSVTAVYGGDGFYTASTSPPVIVTVVPSIPPVSSVPTGMGLGGWDSQPPPWPPNAVVGMPQPLPMTIQSYQGDELTFLSELYYSIPLGTTHGTPTGSITFYDGAQVLSVVPVTFGPVESCNWFCNGPQARLLTNVLTVGTHTITAVYDGDGFYTSSTSPGVTVTVLPAIPPVSSIGTSIGFGGWDSQAPPGVAVGMPKPLPTTIQIQQDDEITFLSELRFGLPSGTTHGPPTGSITFRDGEQLLAVVPLSVAPVQSCDFFCTGLQAKLVTNTLAAGTHAITAKYAGDGFFTGSTSDAVIVTVITRQQAALAVANAIEYHHAAFDHYFVTAAADEIAKLDAGVFAGWTRTGETFKVYTTASAELVPTCRFFTTAFPPTSSHFYAPHGLGCEATLDNEDWDFEGDVFFARLPDASGTCPAGTVPVYRLYNNGQGGAPNHRFTTHLDIRRQMLDRGYIAEGAGIGVGMCSPL